MQLRLLRYGNFFDRYRLSVVFIQRQDIFGDRLAAQAAIPLPWGIFGGGWCRSLRRKLIVQFGGSRGFCGLLFRRFYGRFRLLLLFFLLAEAQPGEKPTFFIFCHVLTLLRTNGLQMRKFNSPSLSLSLAQQHASAMLS
ncbi:hypothetical protein D3C79_788310 [compost metagenome]